MNKLIWILLIVLVGWIAFLVTNLKPINYLVTVDITYTDGTNEKIDCNVTSFEEELYIGLHNNCMFIQNSCKICGGRKAHIIKQIKLENGK